MKKLILSLSCVVATTTLQAVNPVMDKVIDFVPAPGQFVNIIPEYEEGDDAEIMAQKALQTILDDGMVSLGAWGGYITVGFSHTIVNVAGQRDIFIEGNSFNSNSSTNGGSSEPGVVLVAYDINQNGLPDDNEWFEIAGSEYSRSITDYRITYKRPSSLTDEISWSDNKNATGKVERNQFHSQSYWPLWIESDALSFVGTLLPKNAVNEGTSDNPYFVLKSFDYGYADNQPNMVSGMRNSGACIDIDWAVDKEGNPVKMPGVDFVRIYTGENQTNGWIGETSTEVCRVMNNHTVTIGNEEVVDESVTIDNDVLEAFLQNYGGVGTPRSEDLRLYFNPSVGEVEFTLVKPSSAYIYNQAGQLMAMDILSEGAHTLSLATFPTGLYIVRVADKSIKILKK